MHFGWMGSAASLVVYSGQIKAFVTPEIDFKTVADYTIALPAGLRFYTRYLDAVVTQRSGGAVTTQPTLRWGITGNAQKYKANTVMTLLTDAGKRETFSVLLADDGETTSLLCGVSSAGAGPTTYKGYLVYEGILL